MQNKIARKLVFVAACILYSLFLVALGQWLGVRSYDQYIKENECFGRYYSGKYGMSWKYVGDLDCKEIRRNK